TGRARVDEVGEQRVAVAELLWRELEDERQVLDAPRRIDRADVEIGPGQRVGAAGDADRLRGRRRAGGLAPRLARRRSDRRLRAAATDQRACDERRNDGKRT